MIGLLFAATLVIETPQGGLSAAPIGIAERAADGMIWTHPGDGITWIALAE